MEIKPQSSSTGALCLCILQGQRLLTCAFPPKPASVTTLQTCFFYRLQWQYFFSVSVINLITIPTQAVLVFLCLSESLLSPALLQCASCHPNKQGEAFWTMSFPCNSHDPEGFRYQVPIFHKLSIPIPNNFLH